MRLVKGGIDLNAAGSEYKVDGLAGATLTSNGVSNLIQFWMGEDAFGPYLERVRSRKTQAKTQVRASTSNNGENS